MIINSHSLKCDGWCCCFKIFLQKRLLSSGCCADTSVVSFSSVLQGCKFPRGIFIFLHVAFYTFPIANTNGHLTLFSFPEIQKYKYSCCFVVCCCRVMLVEKETPSLVQALPW